MDSQVKSLHYNWWLNFENGYQLLKKLSSEVKILQIDDVIITGATINNSQNAVKKQKNLIS